MKEQKYMQPAIFLILFFLIFIPWKGDLTLKYAAFTLLNYLHGFLYLNPKLKKVNTIISAVATLLVYILGFGFNYFKWLVNLKYNRAAARFFNGRTLLALICNRCVVRKNNKYLLLKATHKLQTCTIAGDN